MDLKRILPVSPPGWALASIAVLTIIMQSPNIFNASGFMKDFQLANEQAAKMIGEFHHTIHYLEVKVVLNDSDSEKKV